MRRVMMRVMGMMMMVLMMMMLMMMLMMSMKGKEQGVGKRTCSEKNLTTPT